MEKNILSISQLTRSIKMHIENNFFDVWITGEISNLKTNKNGHSFFSLKDEGAVINAVIWRNLQHQIKYDIENGLKIVAHGRINLYEKGGNYNIIIDYLEPEGMGDLMLEFLKLKEKLKQAGYFDEQQKKIIPDFPGTVGIVTSPTGAALRDILNVMNRRFSNVNVIVYPARVQGDKAAGEIADMIKIANDLKQVDVLIVSRGGGSYEDLWAFNEMPVADAIFNSELPVISAVGHEVDVTISDYVADLRMPTPSAAAEIVVGSKEEIKTRLNAISSRIQNYISSFINFYKEKTKRFAEENFGSKINRILEKNKFLLTDIDSRMLKYMEEINNLKKNKFLVLTEKLGVLNPLSTLSRGYSITYKVNGQKKIIKSSRDLKIDDKVRIKFHEGESICKVEKVNE